MSKYNNKKNKTNRIFANRSIRASRVRCIDELGENRGVLNLNDAIKIAENAGLDLVQISYAKRGDIPTCKVLDYGKYKYDLSKKEKEQNRKQRESAVKLKEITFRPCTDNNDLSIKARQAKKFLNNGDQVKLSVRFKKSELRHSHVGFDRMNELLEILNSEADIKYLSKPEMSGKLISAVIVLDAAAKPQKQAS